MSGLKILGLGAALPKLKVTNMDLSKIVDTSDEWIYERTGIRSRYFAQTENTSDLGTLAAREAIEKSGIDPKSIDLILCATLTPDAPMPATAALIQAKLGLNKQACLAFDINVACSGFLVALQTADAYLQTGLASCALVIGAETLSKILDFKDRSSCILFGDGAGAMIVKMDPNVKPMLHYARTEGDLENALSNDSTPLNPGMILNQEFKGYLRMKGQPVFRFAIKAIEDGIKEVLKKSNSTLEEIDWIVPHQANVRIIQHVADKMGLPIRKFYLNLERVGNTSSASIPMALSEMNELGLLKSGQKLIMVGFGAGLTWASTIIEL